MNPATQNPLLTAPVYPQLLRLMLPLLLGNVLQQCYNIADSMIIGHYLGMDAFAAIGIAGTIMNLMIFILNGFCMGLSVIFSMLYGKEDWGDFRKEMFVSVSYGSVLTIFISVFFLIILKPLLSLIQTPLELVGYVSEYLSVIAIGLIGTYVYNLFSGILRSIGNTASALSFLLISVLINIFLDLLFVVELHMGIAGAAWATVAAQILSAIGCFRFLHKKHLQLIFTRKDIGLHRDLLKMTLRYGAASSIQESNLYIGKMLVQGSVNLLGTAAIAGFTAALRLEGFCNSFGDSGALAMSVLISQNYGSGQKKRIQECFKKGVLFHIILGITIPALMFFFASPGLRLFLDNHNISAMEQGSDYLKIISMFYILCFIGSALVGYFRGIGMIHVPVIGTTLNISTRVLLAYPITQKWGLPGLAIATGIGWIMVVGYQIWNLQKTKTQPSVSPT